MHHLWLPQNDRWEPAPLSGAALALEAAGLRFRVTPDDSCVLLAAPGAGVRVNGRALVAGLRVLRERDEIVLGSTRCFFSTERLAGVEPFAGADGAVFCARCRQSIEPGSTAVRCPGCGTWCHERAELGCWTYAPKCPLCDQPTALDAGYRWEPEF